MEVNVRVAKRIVKVEWCCLEKITKVILWGQALKNEGSWWDDKETPSKGILD